MPPKFELRVVVGSGDPLALNGVYVTGETLTEAVAKATRRFCEETRLVRYVLFKEAGNLTGNQNYLSLKAS